ncbi:isochorismatase family protein [Candidatus Kaiserbacteria bacterium]|nr:isochorismatase family protein [Candidatus Kaiserbacteria bacterium]
MEFQNNGVGVALIDMQEGFVDRLSDSDYETLVESQICLVQECMKTKTPLFLMETREYGSMIDVLNREIDRDASNVAILSKRGEDGLDNLTSQLWLAHFGIDTLILTGMSASFCVLETAQSLVHFGYRIVTADNLIMNGWTRNPEYREHPDYLTKHQGWYTEHGVYFSEGVDPQELIRA